MINTMKANPYFSEEARNRVLIIFPMDGEVLFDKLIEFVSIATKYPTTPFVVPPELDSCLHEILAVRDDFGSGLESIKFSHFLATELGNTAGKQLSELTSPIASRTCKLLENEGFAIDHQASFDQPACTFTVLSELSNERISDVLP